MAISDITYFSHLFFKGFNYLYYFCYLNAHLPIGQTCSSWRSLHKPFSLCFFKFRCLFNMDLTTMGFKRMFLFIAQALTTYRRSNFLFVNGLSEYMLPSEFLNLSKFHLRSLGHGYVVRWLSGFLTNMPNLLAKYWLPREKTSLHLYSVTKRKLFFENEFGLKTLRRFPDFICFFRVVGLYEIAIKEAIHLKIPVFAFVNSDGDVDNLQYFVTGNDTSIVGFEFKIFLFRELLLRTLKCNLFNEFAFSNLAMKNIKQLLLDENVKSSIYNAILPYKSYFTKIRTQIRNNVNNKNFFFIVNKCLGGLKKYINFFHIPLTKIFIIINWFYLSRFFEFSLCSTVFSKVKLLFFRLLGRVSFTFKYKLNDTRFKNIRLQTLKTLKKIIIGFFVRPKLKMFLLQVNLYVFLMKYSLEFFVGVFCLTLLFDKQLFFLAKEVIFITFIHFCKSVFKFKSLVILFVNRFYNLSHFCLARLFLYSRMLTNTLYVIRSKQLSTLVFLRANLLIWMEQLCNNKVKLLLQDFFTLIFELFQFNLIANLLLRLFNFVNRSTAIYKINWLLLNKTKKSKQILGSLKKFKIKKLGSVMRSSFVAATFLEWKFRRYKYKILNRLFRRRRFKFSKQFSFFKMKLFTFKKSISKFTERVGLELPSGYNNIVFNFYKGLSYGQLQYFSKLFFNGIGFILFKKKLLLHLNDFFIDNKSNIIKFKYNVPAEINILRKICLQK